LAIKERSGVLSRLGRQMRRTACAWRIMHVPSTIEHCLKKESAGIASIHISILGPTTGFPTNNAVRLGLQSHVAGQSFPRLFASSECLSGPSRPDINTIDQDAPLCVSTASKTRLPFHSRSRRTIPTTKIASTSTSRRTARRGSGEHSTLCASSRGRVRSHTSKPCIKAVMAGP